MKSIGESSTSAKTKPESLSLSDQIRVLVGESEKDQTESFHHPTLYEHERCLVAWVLLTRLQHEELCSVWAKSGLYLARFAESILAAPNEQDPCSDLYIRLIAQVTSRLVDKKHYAPKLGSSLFHAWKHNASISTEMNIDVCNSLEIFIQQHPDKAKELDVLGSIWEVYSVSNDERRKRTERTCAPAASSSEDSSKDWILMAQTLEGILQNPDPDYYSQSTWDETVLSLLQSYGVEFLPEPVVSGVLTWISESTRVKKLPIDLRSIWCEWFMELVQARLSVKKDDPSSFRFTLRRNGVAEKLNQFLLAMVVSPLPDTNNNNNSQSFSLRALAWQTTVGIVDECGWGWMLPKPVYGMPGTGQTTLNTWIRLACGEWRIQLQAEDPSSSTGHQTASLPIGHACARMLMNAVDFCVELEEKTTLDIPPDVILGLRQALEDTLATTVEYLNTARIEEVNSDGMFSTIAIRLLGSILREGDIWSLLDHSQETPQGIIDCLTILLSTKEADHCLLPGLVNMLAAADTDRVKQSQIECLWDPLINYLEGFWRCQGRKHNNTAQWLLELEDCITWASSCTELWADEAFESSNNTLRNRRRLQLALVEFIQTIVTTIDLPIQQQQKYLSLAVSSYMTLSKEDQQPPTDHESQVIFQALKICEG